MTDDTPATTPLPSRMVLKVAFVAVLVLPIAAGARTTESSSASPPQACLSPAEMAALLPASREQAGDFCETSDARVLERVRAVLRLLDAGRPGAPAGAPGAYGESAR